MWFFSNYPKVKYITFGDNIIESTDLTKRFKFIEKILKNKYILFNYFIKEGERPDIIAHKYYDDSKLDWIILLTNKIIDPYFDWPLSNEEFDNFIAEKYESIVWAKQNWAKYYKIFQAKETTYDGFQIPEKLLEIDSTAWQNLSAYERKRISYYDYEKEINQKKKIIKLIEKSFVPQIIKEAEKIYG